MLLWVLNYIPDWVGGVPPGFWSPLGGVGSEPGIDGVGVGGTTGGIEGVGPPAGGMLGVGGIDGGGAGGVVGSLGCGGV